jgi:hypothetical protein
MYTTKRTYVSPWRHATPSIRQYFPWIYLFFIFIFLRSSRPPPVAVKNTDVFFKACIGVDGLQKATHDRALNIDTSYSVHGSSYLCAWREFYAQTLMQLLWFFSLPVPLVTNPTRHLWYTPTTYPFFLWTPILYQTFIDHVASFAVCSSFSLQGFPVYGPRSVAMLFQTHISDLIIIIIITRIIMWRFPRNVKKHMPNGREIIAYFFCYSVVDLVLIFHASTPKHMLFIR